MDNLVIRKSTIKEIPVKDEEGNLVHTLRVDIGDGTTAERFANIIKRIDGHTKEFEEQTKKLTEEDGDKIDLVIKRCKTNVEYLEKLVYEIDSIFGKDTIRNIYKANYNMNPDYCPDETALAEFIESAIPIMNSLFDSRFEETRRKYNTGRKGNK